MRQPLSTLISVFICLFVACHTYAAEKKVARPANILILGDSLSAAYGLPQANGWVALLQQKLIVEKYAYQVTNASISGETTIGGANRIDNLLSQHRPNIVVIELGANDALRGLPTQAMEQNLNNIIVKTKKTGAKILIIGMKIPPNYGADYTQSFSNTFLQLSHQHKIALVPFLFEGMATQTKYIQDDGLHPNALAQPILLENVWQKLQPLLRSHH